MSDINKELTVTEYVTHFSKTLTTEIFSLLDADEKKLNKPVRTQVVHSLVGSLIATEVYRILNKTGDGLTKEEMATRVIKDFQTIKNSLQEIIAAAFTGAMGSYSGKDIDYYCKIQAVEMLTRKVC